MRRRPGLYAAGLLDLARGDADTTNAQAAAIRLACVLVVLEDTLTDRGRRHG